MYTLAKTNQHYRKTRSRSSCYSEGARAPIVFDLSYQLRPEEFKPLLYGQSIKHQTNPFHCIKPILQSNSYTSRQRLNVWKSII